MKPKVAFFDFTCCEGCQLQIADLEEDIIGLVNLVDVVEFREVLTGKAPRYDIAFIEGSISPARRRGTGKRNPGAIRNFS